MPLGQKWSFRWRPMASIYFGQVSLPFSFSSLLFSLLLLFPFSLIHPSLSNRSFPPPFYRFLGRFRRLFRSLPSLFLSPDFAISSRSAATMHPRLILQSACIMNVCHIRQLISVDRCHAKTVCATPARLRYRFPMLAQRYALSRLMDSSSFVARTSLTFNANAFQKFLD